MLATSTFRKVRWSLYVILAIIVVIEVSRAYPFLIADRYFDYQVNYGPYHIRSDEVIDHEVYRVFDEVSDRLSIFRDSDTDKPYDIFLCGDQQLYGRFAKITGRSAQTQGFNLLPLKKIFINLTYIDVIHSQNENEKYQYNLLDGDPAHIVAHEIVHGWIQDELGYWKARKLDTWKREGYCEYVASKKVKLEDPEYSLEQSIEDFKSGYFSDISPELMIYIKGEMMVEQLMEEGEMSFVELVDTKINLETILD